MAGLYGGYVKPKKSLATAAAGKTYQDPFGLSQTRAPAQMQQFGVAPVSPDPTGGGEPVGQPKAPATRPGPASEAPLSPGPTPYDINADPIYAQITAFLGKSDEQAKAAALEQRKHALLAYGDEALAKNVLGDPDIATAAAHNPVSTLAGLKGQREKNVHDLTEYLNSNNLLYSGHRINEEKQGSLDYQNALAKAAAAIGDALGLIDSNLTGTLGANQMHRIDEEGKARDRNKDKTGEPAPTEPTIPKGEPIPAPPAVPLPGGEDPPPTDLHNPGNGAFSGVDFSTAVPGALVNAAAGDPQAGVIYKKKPSLADLLGLIK